MPTETTVRPGETKQQYTARQRQAMIEETNTRKDNLASGKTMVTMDVDDFGFLLPGFDDLKRLKESLPGLKVTCFTIPMDNAFFHSGNAKHFKWASYEKWARIVNESGWIEIATHGFAHVPNECSLDYDKAMTLITATEKLFERVGLRYTKLFKAPYWQYSYDFLVALRDKGYTIAIDRNHLRPVPPESKAYVYNWSFEEPIPFAPTIRGHGHFTGRNLNNISTSLHNICKQLPATARFGFVSEYLKDHDDAPLVMRQFQK